MACGTRMNKTGASFSTFRAPVQMLGRERKDLAFDLPQVRDLFIHHNMSSTLSAAANLAKLCIGVGVLALPYATSLGGLVFAPVIIGVIAVWNAVACAKMVECKDTCAECSFPSHLSSTYSRIAYAGAGALGVAVTDFSIIVTLIGVSIAYQITFAQLLQDIPWTNFSTETLTIVFAVLALPLCCVPNVGVLAVFSLVGLVCLIVSVVAIISYGVILHGPSAAADPLDYSDAAHVPLPLWPDSLGNLTSFVGVATFCFGLCSLAFPVEESMRDKSQFGKAVVWSLVFVWFVYALFGDLGAFLYAHDAGGIKDNVLSNLPTDSFAALLVRLAMTAVSLLTYPLTLVPPAQMIEHYILSGRHSITAVRETEEEEKTPLAGKQQYGALDDAETAAPTSQNSPLSSQPASEKAAEGETGGSEGHLQHSTNSGSGSGANAYSRLLTRGAIVLATTVIATFVPCFGMVIALLGGFTVTILGFILPTYLHLQIVGYQNITGLPAGASSYLPGAVQYSAEQRAAIVKSDIVQTVAGVVLCAVATGVTTISFLAKVNSPNGQCK